MRLPYSWLREVVAVGASGWDVTPGELEQTLLRIGHEVEEVIPLGPVDGPVTVGRVRYRGAHRLQEADPGLRGRYRRLAVSRDYLWCNQFRGW